MQVFSPLITRSLAVQTFFSVEHGVRSLVSTLVSSSCVFTFILPPGPSNLLLGFPLRSSPVERFYLLPVIENVPRPSAFASARGLPKSLLIELPLPLVPHTLTGRKCASFSPAFAQLCLFAPVPLLLFGAGVVNLWCDSRAVGLQSPRVMHPLPLLVPRTS